jgi:hypothetical protein
MGFNPNQPRDAKGRWSAVGAYISEDGFAMNETCRTGNPDDDPRIAQLDDAIAEGGTAYEGELYRGMGDSFTDYAEMDRGIRLESDTDYTEQFDGFTFEDPAFVSTTMDKNLAVDFATRSNGIGTMVIVKKAPRSLNVSDVMGDDANWQEERILPRGTSFKTKAARTETINGRDILVLEVEAY